MCGLCGWWVVIIQKYQFTNPRGIFISMRSYKLHIKLLCHGDRISLNLAVHNPKLGFQIILRERRPHARSNKPLDNLSLI